MRAVVPEDAVAEYRTAIEIAASPASVFEHLVTEDGMTAWMGQWARFTPVPGGAFAVDIAGSAIRGEFLEVDPPRRLVVSWGMLGSADLPPGASTVTFELTPTASGTHVELTHAGLPESAVPGHASGWTHFLPRLAGSSTGDVLGADPWRPIPGIPEGAPLTGAGTSVPGTAGAAISNPAEIVDAYHAAWTGGDVERAIALLDDAAELHAPDERVRTKDDWRRFLTGFVPNLTGAPLVDRLVDDDRVALWYLPQTAATSTALAAELFTVHDGRITGIRLVFDRLAYAPAGTRP